MKRKILTIQQFDYTSVEETEQHAKEMKEKGYRLVDNGQFGGVFPAVEIVNGGKWTFTASYYKEKL